MMEKSNLLFRLPGGAKPGNWDYPDKGGNP